MTITKSDVKIKNDHKMVGRDGLTYSADFYINGKKAFSVFNDGNGGPTEVEIHSAEEHEAFVQLAKETYPDNDFKYVGPDEWLAADMLDEYDNDKRMRAYCKSNIVYRTTDCKEDEFCIIKANVAITGAILKLTEDRLKAMHGDKFIELINKKYI